MYVYQCVYRRLAASLQICCVPVANLNATSATLRTKWRALTSNSCKYVQMPRYEVDHNYSRLRNIVRMQFLYFYLVHYYYYYYYYYHYAASPCVGYSIYPIRGLLLLMYSCLAAGDCVWPVYLSVRHIDEPCKNDWINPVVVWDMDSWWPLNHVGY